MKFEPKRKFTGIWIPAELWLDRTLSITEKAIYAEVRSLDNEKGCYADNEYLADFFKLSERQLQRHLKTLKNGGWIIIKNPLGKNRTIVVNPDKSVAVTPTEMTPNPDRNDVRSIYQNKSKDYSLPPMAGEKEIMEAFRAVNPSIDILFARMNQRQALRRMAALMGEDGLLKMIQFLPQNNSTPYSPKATTPLQLEEKLGLIRAFWQQHKQKSKPTKIGVV